MTNEQRKAIDKLTNGENIDFATLIRTFKKEGIENFAVVRKEYLDTVLSLIKEQEKQIDLMAESIELQQYANIDTSNLDLVCEKLKCNKKCELVKKDCIKQYFAGLVEKE